MSTPRFDAIAILKTLVRHDVRFVVIGAFAGRLWGSPTLTRDLDVCYARDRRNLEALAAALGELKARLRAPKDVPFRLDARSLVMGDTFTFTTDLGDLDCIGTPSGSRGFEELAANATEFDLEDVRVPVVSLDDLIRLKVAAGRPKDRIEAEVLGALRQEIAVREGKRPKRKRS